MKIIHTERLIRCFVGFFLISVSFSVGTYSGVGLAEENAYDTPFNNHEILKLPNIHKDRIKEAIKVSNDEWSGQYSSRVYGELLIEKNKGFHLESSIFGCFESSDPGRIGKVVWKSNSVLLERYRIAHTANLPQELNELVFIKHNNKQYLVPQKYSEKFVTEGDELEGDCRYIHECLRFFAKKNT